MDFARSLSHEPGSGVETMRIVLSGPTGVGKSVVCLLSFLLACARKLPVVYVPRTAEWVSSCSTDEESYCYFLKEFFRQNADVIADDPGLRNIFKGQLFSNEEFQAKQYGKLSRHSLQTRRCGFLLDEIQVLTKAVLSGKPFFDKDFTTWTGPAGRFCSILCGGKSFGHQGYDRDRIKHLQPFGEETSRALTMNVDSPFFLSHDEGLISKILEATGGMPNLLTSHLVVDEKEELKNMYFVTRKIIK
jgi:hypothetical protein